MIFTIFIIFIYDYQNSLFILKLLRNLYIILYIYWKWFSSYNKCDKIVILFRISINNENLCIINKNEYFFFIFFNIIGNSSVLS